MEGPIHLVKTTFFAENAMRFCVNCRSNEQISPDYILSPEAQKLETRPSADEQGFLRSEKDQTFFLYDPLTGNYKLNQGKEEILSGQAHFPADDSPRMFLRLREGDSLFGLGGKSRGLTGNNQEYSFLNHFDPNEKSPDGGASSFPFLIIKNGRNFRGVFFHCTYPLKIAADSEGLQPEGPGVFLSMERGGPETSLDVFFFHGDLPDIMKAYARVTGFPFLPRTWSLGFLHAGSYKNAERTEQVLSDFKEKEWPIDSLILREKHLDDQRLFTWHPTRFPDSRAFVKRLEKNGVRLISEMEPAVLIESGYKIYEQCAEGEHYCRTGDGYRYTGRGPSGPSLFCDFTRPKTRKWWAERCREYSRDGAAGFSFINNEPVLQSGRKYNPFEEDIRLDGGKHQAMRNIYSSLQARASFESFSKKRSFVLTQSSFAGIQKYAAVLWKHKSLNWSVPRRGLHTALNLGLSGVPLVAQFFQNASKKMLLLKKNELLQRWIELNTLLPLCATEEALFESPSTLNGNTLNLLRKHLNRRYSLLPYLYSLVRESANEGSPVVRPVFYEFPELDPEANQDDFMLGPALLAAPILDEGVSRREVTLPPGLWFEYETGKPYRGEETYRFGVKPGYYPLFVRSGAVLPKSEPRSNALETLGGDLFLEIYPEQKIFGRVLLDDFVSSAQEENSLTLTVEGESDRTHNISLELRAVRSGEAGPREAELRLPPTYRFMEQGGKTIEGTPLNLSREDRLLSMSAFRVKLEKETRLYFPYKPAFPS